MSLILEVKRMLESQHPLHIHFRTVLKLLRTVPERLLLLESWDILSIYFSKLLGARM